MRLSDVCVGFQGMCVPQQTAHVRLSPAQILNDWGVQHTHLKRTRPPTAVIEAYAGACGRLTCASGSRACVHPSGPLMAT